MHKTFWATTSLTFLGLLIDSIRQLVMIPVEKNHESINVNQWNPH